MPRRNKVKPSKPHPSAVPESPTPMGTERWKPTMDDRGDVIIPPLPVTRYVPRGTPLSAKIAFSAAVVVLVVAGLLIVYHAHWFPGWEW